MADSAFVSLREVIMEIGRGQVGFPKYLMEGLVKIVESAVKKRTGLEIDSVNLENVVGKI